jgi:hypothetical protein
MSATLLYRIAAVLLILFAAGHTFGFLAFRPPSQEGLAVRDAMNNVAFQFKGSSYTYGNFYKGFGLTVTVYLLFSCFLAWHLGNVASSQPQSIGLLGWIFAATQLTCLILSVMYFFLLPALLSGVVVLCLAWAAWLAQQAAA